MNSTDPDTPLVVATTHGLTDCIKYLLKAGANANIPNSCVSIFQHFYSFYLLIVLAACSFVNHAIPSGIFFTNKYTYTLLLEDLFLNFVNHQFCLGYLGNSGIGIFLLFYNNASS